VRADVRRESAAMTDDGRFGQFYHLMRKPGRRASICPPFVAESSSTMMAFDRERMRERAASLAVQGVYLGTSSWKYEGWLGQLYTADRYEYRGKVAKTRFERDCLGEYAEIFNTVCVDAAYYTFPSQLYLERMVGQVPEDFLFGLKVTDAITIKNYPKLDRFGDMAGKPNENFLNADLFAKAFLHPREAVRSSIGLLIRY
jgi:hypothetical protein